MLQVSPVRVPRSRPHLLFLCHRIPYPPNKGDKIRSFHLLRYLSQRYRVHLGTFIDDPADLAHTAVLQEMCESVLALRLNPLTRQLVSLSAFVTGEALTVPYYRSRRLQNWADDVMRRYSIQRLLVFSSSMAQFVFGELYANATKVIDFVDVDSDKWGQYGGAKPWYSAWIYRRESRKLARFERRAARMAQASILVSDDEARVFDAVVGAGTRTSLGVPNGVDAEYFSPNADLASPYPAGGPNIVFTGAMSYWANEDAVVWFARDILPLIRGNFEDCRFYIVGMGPSRSVRELASDHVIVTGAVDDVRPYLRYADAVVAPMRIARGIQNKVLEGMAMGRPVITTSKGLEGITANSGTEVLVADAAEVFASLTIRVLRGDYEDVGQAARTAILRSHSWEASLCRIVESLEQPLSASG